MQLVPLDWLIIGLYGIAVLAIGLAFGRLASTDAEGFFLSGRRLTWWVAGTSMVATTFAADTPLAITGIVRKQGVSGNWFWWSLVMSAMVWAWFYARLWRRAEIVTDAEFVAIRYEGRAATVLRLFKACYASLVINGIVMGWVIRGMAKFCQAALGWPDVVAIPALMLLALVYSGMAGLWGVVMTDLLQFALAMAGSIFLAVVAVQHFGGLGELHAAVLEATPRAEQLLSPFPEFSELGRLALITFGVYLGVQWWAGRNADGGEYIAQRMMACRSERDAHLATLWYALAHYVLRPWPWIIVALASLAVFPDLTDHEMAYPKMMVSFLPDGWRGVMVASLLAAFMSTIDTHLNWGASYLINDLAKGLLGLRMSGREEAWLGRAALVLMAGVAGWSAFKIESIEWAWKFLLALGAGAGLVTLLRWYWWRINAWSELSALAASLVTAVVLFSTDPWRKAEYEGVRVLIVVAASAAVWLPVTFLTRPVSTAHLQAFYRRVRPAGWGWRAIEPERPPDGLRYACAGWIGGVLVVYGSLFGLGGVLLASGRGFIALCAAAVVVGMLALRYGLRPG